MQRRRQGPNEDELSAEKARADKYLDMMDSLRYKYFKDLINVRAYAEKLESELRMGAINRRPKQLNQSIEEVLIKNVQFFDQTEGIDLNAKNKELLNDKLQKLTKDFNERLIKLSLQNHVLSAQITKYKVLNENTPDGQKVAFDISEIDTAQMIKKLLVVSDDAHEIWYHFNVQQPGFFLKVIQEEYGIDKNFSRKVLDDYDEEVKVLQNQFDAQMKTMSQGYRDQIEALTQRNRELTREITSTKLQLGPALGALKDKIDAELLVRFNQQMEDFLKSKTQQLKYKQQVIEKQYRNLDTMRERLLDQKKQNAKLLLSSKQGAPQSTFVKESRGDAGPQAFITQPQPTPSKYQAETDRVRRSTETQKSGNRRDSRRLTSRRDQNVTSSDGRTAIQEDGDDEEPHVLEQDDEGVTVEEEDDDDEDDDEVRVQDLYIPDVDEMEKEIAYLNFKIEKEQIVMKQWKRLHADQSRVVEEQASYINYNLIAIKEAQIETQTVKTMDSEVNAYVRILEEQIEGVRKQLEQRKIFNPLEARIILNPLIEMRRVAAMTHSNNRHKLMQMQKENLRPRKFSQYVQTEIQNTQYKLIQLPKGKTLEDLKPPKKIGECQAKPVMKNRTLQVVPSDFCTQSSRLQVDGQAQTDLLMDHVFSKEEVDLIRESNVERNVVYNQEGIDGADSPMEPASALLPVAEVQKKRNNKKKVANGRRFTVAAPAVDDLDNYYNNNKALHIQDQSLNLQEEADPEKQMIQKKIQDNIKKALKSHFSKKILKVQKRNAQTEPQQKHAEIKMINIIENETGNGPSIDFQHIPEEYAGAPDKPINLSLDKASSGDEPDAAVRNRSQEEGPNVRAMRQKQLQSAKARSIKPKKTENKKQQKFSNQERVIRVIPYGIHSLENFLETKINKQRKVSEGTQTFESSFSFMDPKESLKMHKQILLSLYNKQKKTKQPVNQTQASESDDGSEQATLQLKTAVDSTEAAQKNTASQQLTSGISQSAQQLTASTHHNQYSRQKSRTDLYRSQSSAISQAQRHGQTGKATGFGFLGDNSYNESGNSRRRTTYSRNKHGALGPSRTTELLSHSQSEASYFRIPTASNADNQEHSVTHFRSERPSDSITGHGPSARYLQDGSPKHPYNNSRAGQASGSALNNDLPSGGKRSTIDQAARPSSNYRIMPSNDKNHASKQVQFKEQLWTTPSSNQRSRRGIGHNWVGRNSSKTAAPNFELNHRAQGAEGDPYQLDKRGSAIPKKSLLGAAAQSQKELRDWASNPGKGAAERDENTNMMVTGLGRGSQKHAAGDGRPFRVSSGMPVPRLHPTSKKVAPAFRRKPKGLTLYKDRLSQVANEQGIRESSDQLSTLRRHESSAQLQVADDVGPAALAPGQPTGQSQSTAARSTLDAPNPLILAEQSCSILDPLPFASNE